ncbi:ABC transporter substrate-binding protein [Neobacillus notoginsengisoli]|uniref:ABC transporter substrate-binding protein n=1 Tax=Neobacillus notoginsengisoli TaxID=1578198 RepID=A0A417YWL7_9BACI|nr:ABC transporter substrate-binding protein [Neobacillus notoginsengisoli]RHW41726.1 ABC transporter substrate-binding protein [Neobacillus notoginsengisoli]
MNKTLKMLLVSLLAVSLLLAGCNGGDGTKKSSGNKGGNSGDNGSKQDTLVYARGADSVTLDPITTTEGETFKVTENIYDTLVNFGESDTSIQPELAEEWKLSDDSLTYTFKLVKGVKFHDGTDFNAEAVKYNFERWAGGNAEKFPYYTMFGGYKGDAGHVIKEIKVVDEHTIQFNLTRPQATFLVNLAMTCFGIASPAALEKYGDDFRKNPVGTGAFKFVEWKENDTITLEKNADYWKKGYPKLNKVIFRVIPENTARLNALKTGEIDLMDGLNYAEVDQVTSDDKLQLIERPSMNIGYLGMTVNRKPFDNKLVRQALNHAVDKESIIKAFYAGMAEPAVNPMPTAIKGYNEDIEPYPYDLEKAKALLKEAGYEKGFKMDLWAMPVARLYMPEGQKVAEIIQESFSKIGVDAEIKTVDWPTYLEKAAKGEFDAFMLGWTGDNGDADNFLYTLLDKDSIGGNNYTYYANDELHDVLIQAQSETDEAKRSELYKKAQEIIHDDAPWIPLVHSRPLSAGVKGVSGYVPHPTGSESLMNVEFK